jgi:error-prone DNA polymerase
VAGTPPYAELHAHSAYSLLDGTSLPEELVQRAGELGYTAHALTDHDSLAGAMELAVAARDSPVRAIFGAEATVERGAGGAGTSNGSRYETGPYRHLTLLVRDRRGWRNLCRLLTLAHAGTRDSADRRAGQPSVSLEQVLAHADGLVCLTGCARHGIHDEPTARRLLDAFGPNRLRVELQRPYADGDRPRNRMLSALARRLGVPTVATGDIHAHTLRRAYLQDAFVAIGSGLRLDSSEAQRRANHSHVMSSPAVMAARFAEYPEAVAETVRLAETLTFDLGGDLGYRYPGSESSTATRELAEICHAELARRYPPGHALVSEASGRLEEELRMIDGLGLSGFFVLHREVVELAREVAIDVRGPDTVRALLPPARGRGSSVSSIVCYLAGLSHVDPIENKLAIGRFLHEDIQSLPDIDLDLPRDIRERLIPTVIERYGRERAALVATFPTFKSKGAIRELGKALGLPAGEIDRVARGSEGWGREGAVAQDIRVALGPKRLRENERWEWLARLADEAQGLPRYLSQHPGGMVISTRPLIECCPVVPARMKGRQMIQCDKDSASDYGFLKMDLLGLGMLSAVERCVEEIVRTRGVRIDLSRIPFDDSATWALIQAGDTLEVFQIESRSQIASIVRTHPETLAELAIQVAIIRPGAIEGGGARRYVERREALLRDPSFEITYEHPSLEGALSETLGAIVFQDQVIEVGKSFAGFTAGQAEGLRRAMSRKRSAAAIESHHQEFIQGALRTHADVDEPLAEQVWKMVAGFAGFGFPKSHSVSFSVLAYVSAFLRAHYQEELLCSLMNEQPMGFYAPDSLIHAAQRRGLTVLPPDVSRSEAECVVTSPRTIRLGLNYIKGVHDEDVKRLIATRMESGPFRDLADFAARAGASTPTLELLAWSGACDPLAGGGRHARREALWQLGVARPVRRGKGGDQLALDLPLADAPQLRALSDWEQMIADYQASGVSIDRHPLELLREQLNTGRAITSAQARKTANGRRIQVGGLVIARQQPETANGIVFLLLEDEHGTVDVIVPEKLYEPHRLIIRTQPLILVTGRLEKHISGAINLLAQKIEPLNYATAAAADVQRLPDKQTPPAANGITRHRGVRCFSRLAPRRR